MTDADLLIALIQTHLGRYPVAGVADIYRLLHQGVYGPGHAIPSKKAARELLEQESTRVRPDPQAPMIESIHPEGAIVRVHVCAYLAHRATLGPLLEAWLHSAERVHGDPAQLGAWWQIFEEGCAPGGPWAGRFAAREVHLFGRVRAREDWPIVQHSPAYLAAYRPLYRVLAREDAVTLCEKLKTAFEPC